MCSIPNKTQGGKKYRFKGYTFYRNIRNAGAATLK